MYILIQIYRHSYVFIHMCTIIYRYTHIQSLSIKITAKIMDTKEVVELTSIFLYPNNNTKSNDGDIKK